MVIFHSYVSLPEGTAHQMFYLAEIAAANFISQIEDIEDRNFGLGPAQELARHRNPRKTNGARFWKSFSLSQPFWECFEGYK